MLPDRSKRWLGWLGLIALAAIAAAVLALTSGPSGIPAEKVMEILSRPPDSIEGRIVWDIRFPRLLLGFAVGGALSLAGVILQGMFRNPLVEPYTLGISGGAAVGVSLGILWKFSGVCHLGLPLSGFLGACIVIFLLYFLSRRGRELPLQGMLLTGVMLTFISSSLMLLILAVSRTEDLQGILFWIMGSLDEPDPVLIRIMITVSALGLGSCYFFHADLNALALGEEEARHLGVPVERTKRALFLIASVLTGVSVAVAGVIGFVGLVVPHIMRGVVGRDARILLVTSFLGGGTFLVLCDTVARVLIVPVELPVGVVTGLFGGCLFIYVLVRGKGKAL
jgi:iron complex transport system permease protein